MGYVKEKEAESLVRTVTKSLTAIDCAANKVVKGYFAFCLLNAKLWRSSLGTYQAHSTHRPAPEAKKRWGPALGQPSWGLGKGWSPSQGRNSASSSQKFAHIKRRKSVSPNTERTKPQIKKPHAEKKSRTAILHSKLNHRRASNLHAAN